MITTARRLKDLIRNLSKKKSADAQSLMRNYMMERFLERIALSAEKLETVISRNVTNTRMRDFYDIHILRQIYGKVFPRQCCGMRLPLPRGSTGRSCRCRRLKRSLTRWRKARSWKSSGSPIKRIIPMLLTSPGTRSWIPSGSYTGQEAAYEQWGIDRQGSRCYVSPMAEPGLCGPGREDDRAACCSLIFDVLMDIGVLPKQKYEDWRFGRAPYLEAVIECPDIGLWQ